MTITRSLQGVPKYTICTSATHPSGPSVGDKLYETDTGNELTYQGATDLWTPPWNLPWGRIATGNQTANQSGISTIVDLTSMTVTFTAVAHRLYRATLIGSGSTQGTGSTGHVIVTIETGASGSGTAIATCVTGEPIATDTEICARSADFAVAAGSTSYHGRILTTAATEFRTLASAIRPWTLSIDDVGNDGTAPS